jgi:DNA invertase Pin-like site-specific DNA recombinase
MKVGYCRVSKKEQALDFNALKQQIDRIENQSVDKIYCDLKPGSEKSRPQFKELITAIKNGVIKEIVITRMDRLVRGLKTQIELITLFEEKQIILTVLDQSVDFKTASGKLNLNILGAFGQNYSDDLSEKIRHGYEYYRKIKKSSRTILGYKIVESKIVIDNDPFLCLIENQIEYSKYDIARLVINFYLKYKSLCSCVQKLNQYFGLSKHRNNPRNYKSLHFSVPGLASYLTHPVLKGYLVYFRYDKNKDTQLYPNNHTPILSEIEYAEILTIMKHNKKVRGYGFTSKYPFTGFVCCQNCLYSMNITKGWNRTKTISYEYYKCKNSEIKGCSNSASIRVDKIRAELFLTLQSKYLALIDLTNLPLEVTTESAEIQSLLNQINSLSLLPQNTAIDQAISNIKLQVNDLRHEQPKNILYSHNQDYLKALFSSTSFWETLLPHQLKEIVHKLVDKIIIDKGEVIDIILKI